MASKWILILSTLEIFLTASAKIHNFEDTGTELRFSVSQRDKMCFYHDFERAREYALDFIVLKGGMEDIDVSVESPNGKILYKEHRLREGDFTFESSRGLYTICFDNEFSTLSSKQVYFEIRPTEKESLDEQAGDETPSVRTYLEDLLESIHKFFNKVEMFQTAYRMNETRGRNSAEELNYTVFMWSLVESIVIVVSGMGQIYIVRGLFSGKNIRHTADSKPATAT